MLEFEVDCTLVNGCQNRRLPSLEIVIVRILGIEGSTLEWTYNRLRMLQKETLEVEFSTISE